MKFQNLELPMYRSHKIVGALRIVKAWVSGGICEIKFEDQRFRNYNTDLTGKPTPSAGWYMVFYEDGYNSFSPPQAFEEGYSRIIDASEIIMVQYADRSPSEG